MGREMAEWVMINVLLVEPDDDFCLFLQMSICGNGRRVSVAGSFAEGEEALGDADTIDVVVTASKLPGGSGFILARDAAERGKRTFLLRGHRQYIEVWDRRGILFRGNRLAVGGFLKNKIAQSFSASKTAATRSQETV
jgi:DNA-binding NarL/FixJ family response regulator